MNQPIPTRVQLALNVEDIDEAVAFYGAMFGAEPAKRRPGYADYIRRTNSFFPGPPKAPARPAPPEGA